MNTYFFRNMMGPSIRTSIKPHTTIYPPRVTIDFIDGMPIGEDRYGVPVDPSPFEGEVIQVGLQAVIVKDAPNSFKVCQKSLMSAIPALGEQVAITPYYRKQLDGQRVGSSFLKATQFMNGDHYDKGTAIIGDIKAYIPGAKVNNEYVMQLVNALQEHKLSDGQRHISHFLADIKARSFALFDPTDPLTGTEGAVINFNVNSPKFTGNVVVRYHYERYQFSVYFNGTFDKTFENIPFNGLAKVLEEQLDDVSLTQIKVEVIPATVTEAIGH